MSLRYYLPGAGIQARSEGLSVIREYLKPGTGAGRRRRRTLLTGGARATWCRCG